MNPAIFLVCTTLVTNASSETVATRSCSVEHPPIVLAAATIANTLPVLDMNEVAPAEVKPVAETVKHYQPKRARVAIYIPRHSHYQSRGRIRVIPTANELAPQHKPMSFWDKLKALPDQIAKSIVIE